MSGLLVTVAHPDDETFGTGSVIALAAERGLDVTVCCATRGEAGEAPGVEADLGALREAELRAAGRVLGVSRFILLGYRDSGMDGAPAPGTLTAAPFEDVVADLDQVIDDVQPDVVVTTDPDHGDGHRDHVVIGRATVAAASRRADLRVYGWALPRDLLARWFAELEHVRPESAHLDLDRQGLGRPEEQITAALDVAHLQPLRERAIAMHRSQRSPYEGMPPGLRDDFLRTDRLVRLHPKWPIGEPDHDIF
jgi:LmbE family N-acetylglucosaminyl deacetylase